MNSGINDVHLIMILKCWEYCNRSLELSFAILKVIEEEIQNGNIKNGEETKFVKKLIDDYVTAEMKMMEKEIRVEKNNYLI